MLEIYPHYIPSSINSFHMFGTMEDFNEEEEEEFRFVQSVSVDPRRSRKAKKRKLESQVVSILNHLFVNTQYLYPHTGRDCSIDTNSSDTSCSLNFAKIGKFTSRSPPPPLIKSGAGLDIGHLVKSALAGGISCAFSAFLMHPVDTVKVYDLLSI